MQQESDLGVKPKRKIRIIWDPIKGEATSDGFVKEMAKNLLNHAIGTRTEIFIGQEALINEFRLLVKGGIINHEDIEILVDGTVFHISKRGRIIGTWPRGFCDLIETQLMELIDWNNKYKTTTQ